MPTVASLALSFGARKYLHTSLASAQTCVLCIPDLIPQHRTEACTHKTSANKKINEGTEAPPIKNLVSLQEKLNIINKHDTFIHGINVQ